MRLRKALGLVVCIVAVNCGAPVMAAPAPAAAAKSPAFDGKVEIDPRLGRHAALRALLLEEGKREMAAQKKDADDSRRQDRRSFGDRRWSFERKYRLRAEVDRYVSVVRADATYTGGAHPNSGISTLLWDKSTARVSNIADFFVDTTPAGATLTKLAALVREALAGEKRKRGADVASNLAQDEWLKAVEPSIDKLGQPSLAPSTVAGKSSGVTFHFSPYDVGSYAEGPYVAFIPASELTPLLKPDIRGLFAGQRPRNDVTEWEAR